MKTSEKQTPDDPLSRLRAGTHDLHVRLDRHSLMSRLMTPNLSLDEYAHILLCLLGCQLEFEPVLENLRVNLAAPSDWLDPTIFSRSADLKADLDSLGYRASWQEAVSMNKKNNLALGVSSVAQAAGWMYVLGGSTLGARLIVRRLREQFGQDVEPALAYFSPRAGEAGWTWSAYREVLNAELHRPELEAEALEGARVMFDCFLRHMAIGPEVQKA